MVLREVLLLLLMVVALVVVSTVGTVHEGGFGGGGGLGRDGGVALLLRWGSIAACRRMHGLVRLCWTWIERKCIYKQSQAHILLPPKLTNRVLNRRCHELQTTSLISSWCFSCKG